MAYRNLRLDPLSRLIYLLLRLLVWLGVSVFYRRRLLLDRQNLRFDGPAIVIVNHPSTLMDVLNTALYVRQEMFYLANYGLFKHPVSNWLFRHLFCIPVKRKEDVTEGEERNNFEAFEHSFQHLEKNGVLFIAPEGTSWINRFVRPLKTGTARIAFGAESRNDWKLDVKIMPIGVSYSAPHLFRSEVVVHFGAPVYARDWAGAWTQNHVAGVDELTQHLEDQLKALSLHCRDEAGELLITRLEEMLNHSYPLPQAAAFGRSQLLAKTVLDNAPLQQQVQAYFEALATAGLDDAAVAATLPPRAGRMAFFDGLLLALTAPLFAIGYAFWWLPCYLPWLLNKKMNIYIGYSSTVKIMAGLITFPLALWAAYRAGCYLGHEAWRGWATLGAAVALGYFVEQYQDVYRRFLAGRMGRRVQAAEPAAFQGLVGIRADILAACPK